MTRTLRPEPNELAVFLLNPGETVVIETERGPYRLTGEDPTYPHPEVQVCLVPHTPGAVDWYQTTCTTYGAGPGDARTPTGLRVTKLRRYVRGHKHDEQVWEQARTLLGGSLRACYVRIERVPYYGRTRFGATEARTAHSPALPAAGRSEANDGPGPDGHHIITGECFACMVGVATGPESHGDHCPRKTRAGSTGTTTGGTHG